MEKLADSLHAAGLLVSILKKPTLLSLHPYSKIQLETLLENPTRNPNAKIHVKVLTRELGCLKFMYFCSRCCPIHIHQYSNESTTLRSRLTKQTDERTLNLSVDILFAFMLLWRDFQTKKRNYCFPGQKSFKSFRCMQFIGLFTALIEAI